jgi:hypothetical protein
MRDKSRFKSSIREKPLATLADDLDQSKWYRLYGSAMLELDHAAIAGRIMDARSEILRRLKALKGIPGYEAERLSMEDALSGLRGLEWGEAQYQDERQRQAAFHPAHRRTGGSRPIVTASVPRMSFADKPDSDERL